MEALSSFKFCNYIFGPTLDSDQGLGIPLHLTEKCYCNLHQLCGHGSVDYVSVSKWINYSFIFTTKKRKKVLLVPLSNNISFFLTYQQTMSSAVRTLCFNQLHQLTIYY